MATPPIDYADVQGTILRGYRVELARHFILQVTDAAAAGAFIGNLVNGTGGVPRVTTAQRWRTKPDCFVNISFTAPGLAALGVTDAELKSFDPAYQAGAASEGVANTVGDTGTSAPANWLGGIEVWQNAHVVLSLWVHEDPEVLERTAARLRAGFAAGMRELLSHDATALPDNHVHFGYRDNIAQPTVQGAPPRKHAIPDAQPVVPTGEFLLGYPNASGGTYSVQPAQLSTNSSYAAFRILDQDVVGFEKFLQDHAAQAGTTPEMLAAKVCGRWRNGNPLELRPDEPGKVLPTAQLNDFTYVSTDPSTEDTLGLRCPIGSHIRRTNPRDMAVTGTDSTHHRITRRAIPYGPAYDPASPTDVPRGLIGYFINASIFNQFQFIQGQWALTDSFIKVGEGAGRAAAGERRQQHQRRGRLPGRERPRQQLVHPPRAAEELRHHRLLANHHHARRRLRLFPEHHGAAVPRHAPGLDRVPRCVRPSPAVWGRGSEERAGRGPARPATRPQADRPRNVISSRAAARPARLAPMVEAEGP